MREFSGDLLEWTSFWDSFSSAINENPGLSDVDKMNYLKGLLKGEALKVIGGLTLTSYNYVIAIDLLKERFGKKQVLINAHMEEFLNISVISQGVKSLRDFVDTMVRINRYQLGYGTLLLPILLPKM